MASSTKCMRQVTWRKKLFFSTVLCALTLLACFVGLELYVRLTRPKIDLYVLTGLMPGPNPMTNWALVDAFSAYRGKPGRYAKGKTVNQSGFISTPEVSVEKTDKTIRIAFLGGSSTAGTGRNLRDEDTWPWQTIAMLRQKVDADIDFINGALGGYTSFESYGRLWSRIRHFSPDIVVLYHGWNEMAYFDEVDNIVSWRTLSDGSWSLRKTRKPVAQYAARWFDPLLRWSQSLTRVRLRLSEPLDGELGPSKKSVLAASFDSRAVEVWRTNLRLFRETCRVIRTKLFVVKQATLIVAGLPNDLRKRCKYHYHRFDHDAHVQAFRRIYGVIDEEISPDAVIDVTHVSGRGDLFYDHIHPTPKGAREIAVTISQVLSDYIMAHQRGGQIAPTAPQ